MAEQGAVEEGSAEDAAAGDAAVGEAAAAEPALTQVQAPEGRMIARDATVSILVEDVLEGSARARAAAAAVEGYVVSEEVSPASEAEGSRGYALIVLSVPSEDLDAVITELSGSGTVRSTRMTSEDVTEEFVDTSARVQTLEASIERVRALLGEAADIEDVVALERELSSREAELDALLAVQQSLRADVSRSTLTVELSSDEQLLTAAAEPPEGFLAGLRPGWAAFGATTAVLLTAVGAMLPFAIALALVAVPLVAFRRRRVLRGSAPARPLA